MKNIRLENGQPVAITNDIGFTPKDSLPAPKGVRHPSEITIVDVDDGEGGTRKEAQLDPVKVAAYTQTLADETAAKNQENEIAKRVARLNFCQEVKARVMLVNQSKNWTTLQFQDYMGNPLVQQLSAMLSDGYLDMAKDLIEASDFSAFYTAQEVQSIVDIMDVYLNNE